MFVFATEREADGPGIDVLGDGSAETIRCKVVPLHLNCSSDVLCLEIRSQSYHHCSKV